MAILPKAAVSRVAGRIARHPASRHLIPWFARHYGIDTAAACCPEGGFNSLQQFFCRELRPGVRPIADAPLVSPVDGRVGACGAIRHDLLLQAKGDTYRLGALLGDAAWAAHFQGGRYCTLYLAPADYHRVHAPCAGRLSRTRHLAGTRWPVNPNAVARIPGLFTSNERLVVEMTDTELGTLGLVLVGACLVGGIRLSQGPPFSVMRGGELGWFEFGSTVIVLVPEAAHLELAVRTGERVLMGQALMQRAGSGADAAAVPPPVAC